MKIIPHEFSNFAQSPVLMCSFLQRNVYLGTPLVDQWLGLVGSTPGFLQALQNGQKGKNNVYLRFPLMGRNAPPRPLYFIV